MSPSRKNQLDHHVGELIRAASRAATPPNREFLHELRLRSAGAYEQSFNAPARSPAHPAARSRPVKRYAGLAISAALAAGILVAISLWPAGHGSTAFALTDMAVALQKHPCLIVSTNRPGKDAVPYLWIDLPRRRCIWRYGDESLRVYDLDAATLRIFFPSVNTVRVWSLPEESSVVRMLRGKSDVLDVLDEGPLRDLAKLRQAGVPIETTKGTADGKPITIARAEYKDSRGTQWLAVEVQIDPATALPLRLRHTEHPVQAPVDKVESYSSFSYPSADEMAAAFPDVPTTAEVEDYRSADDLVRVLDLHVKGQSEWTRFRALVFKRTRDGRCALVERVVRDGVRWRFDDFRGQGEIVNDDFEADHVSNLPFDDLWKQVLSFRLGCVELGDNIAFRRYIRGLQPLTKYHRAEAYPTIHAHTLTPVPGHRWPAEVRIDNALTASIRRGRSDAEHPQWLTLQLENDGEDLRAPFGSHAFLRLSFDSADGYVCRRDAGHRRVNRSPWRENPDWQPDEPIKARRPADKRAPDVFYEFDSYVEVFEVGHTGDGRRYPARFRQWKALVYPDGERFIADDQEFIVRVDIPPSVPADTFGEPVDPPGAPDLPRDDGPK